MGSAPVAVCKDNIISENPFVFRISEHEESHRDQARGLSLSQLRTKYLEEENTTLQQRIDSLTRQKQNLDRIVQEYQTERHKEVKIFKQFFCITF